MTSQPQTIEGWQAWDVAAKAITPTMVGRQMVLGIDRALALTQAGLLGYDARVVAILLPVIEQGLWAAIGQIVSPEGDGELHQE